MPNALRYFAILTLLFAGCTESPSPEAAARRDSHALVGTWRGIRYQTWNAQGQIATPFGDPVSGYAVFDDTGHAFIQLMRMPAVQPFQAPAAPTEQEVRDAFSAFAAYYGSYTIDAAASSVTIQVEGSNLPSYTGSRQVRRFQIENDTLTLGIPGQYQATLVRVK